MNTLGNYYVYTLKTFIYKDPNIVHRLISHYLFGMLS